jgi:signal transduction histidine kinase
VFLPDRFVAAAGRSSPDRPGSSAAMPPGSEPATLAFMNAPPIVDLETALPLELTGSTHNWFSRYRRYPVFSRPWVRGRARAWSTILAAVLAVLTLVMLVAAPADRLPGGLAQLIVFIAVPMFAGPWLGALVRRRRWSPATEEIALWLVLLALVALMQVFTLAVAEPMKQFIAEKTGGVDSQGKRRQIVMSVGVSISQPDAPASSASAAGPAAPGLGRDSPINVASSALLSFWLAGGAALFGWRRERSGLQALQAERELADAQSRRREAELRLSVLAAQVEPHFLFNTLAGVRSAIHSDPARASEMIDRLVEYLRASIPRLRSDGSAQATVGGQFDLVRAYLSLMSARMPRLRFTIECPEALIHARCPPLMLISLAENAVKHGVEPKIGPCRIEVRAEHAASGELVLSVLDDGVGFGVSQAGTGLGLSNLRERLAQLYPGQSALTLKARPEGGVAATISLPLET